MTTASASWKNLLLNAYFYGTLPHRRWQSRRATNQNNAPIMVLFYHRVADHTPNEWTIPYRQFSRQIRWLKSRFDFVSLSEAQQRIRSGSNSRAAVSITFDDGYAENCERALPQLLGEGIPVTYFVCSDHVFEQRPFPHDVERGQPLAPNTVKQLRGLAESGIEIGSHTRSHADLGTIYERHRLVDEVVNARDDLQQALGCPVRYFAFPFGLHENLNPDVFDLAREAGYEGIGSAYGGYNFPGDDDFHLQRIHADEDFARFRNWLTVDPRKLARVHRYEYRQ